MKIDSEHISKLLLEIEKVRRRKIADFKVDQNVKYIDISNNLEKIQVGNNHLIFGRRGSGKTTLILAALKSNTKNTVVAIDMQPLKSEKTNDIVIKILLQTLYEMQKNYFYLFSEKEALYKKQYIGIKGLKSWILKQRKKDLKSVYFECIEFQKLLNKEIGLLENLKKVPDEIIYTISEEDRDHNEKVKKESFSETTTQDFELKVGLQSEYKVLSGKVDLAMATLNSKSSIVANESIKVHTTESKASYNKTYRRVDTLKEQREVIAFLFNKFNDVFNVNIVIYLDDFYQVQVNNQPNIIQYLHDIYKCCYNSSFCFKLSALPYRLRMNNDGNVDMSYKDDFSPIKLDSDLSELNTTREYLLSILVNLEPSVEIVKQDIIELFNNEEVLLYAIIATGGVPRDFLLMFADLVEIVRKDNRSTIQKADVYTVVKNLREDKDNNIEYDSNVSPELIHNAVKILEEDVVRKLNTNVILYPKEATERHDILLKNLVNLRYLHIIKDSTTSELKKKEEFTAYLIDMSFYAVNKKLRPGFDFRRFWESDSSSRLSQLRQSKIWNFPDSLFKEIS